MELALSWKKDNFSVIFWGLWPPAAIDKCVSDFLEMHFIFFYFALGCLRIAVLCISRHFLAVVVGSSGRGKSSASSIRLIETEVVVRVGQNRITFRRDPMLAVWLLLGDKHIYADENPLEKGGGLFWNVHYWRNRRRCFCNVWSEAVLISFVVSVDCYMKWHIEGGLYLSINLKNGSINVMSQILIGKYICFQLETLTCQRVRHWSNSSFLGNVWIHFLPQPWVR